MSRKHVGRVLGPLSFLGIYLGGPFGLDPAATGVLASTAWVVVWWISEAVPIPVTALLLGAGFSIARGFQESGLDGVVAGAITSLRMTDLAGLIVLVATVVILLTNVTSNTATASLFMPSR